MTDAPSNKADFAPTRRSFLRTSVAGATAMTAALALPRAVHAAGSDIIRVGLVGCGGRGTGAAAQALAADRGARLVAMGDAFADRLESSLVNLRKTIGDERADQVDVSADRMFIGIEAYKQVIDSGVDVVLLCSPPHFRPAHLEAAIAAGKHVFAEKPVAVDAPGVRRVENAVAEARRKGLSLVSGLCYRYDLPKRETLARVHNGQIGDIVAIHTSYNTGTLWMHPRKSDWSDMEWQLRNWLYFSWLSGDHIVEQHIHSLDKAAWALRDEPPLRAVGLGGRQVRTAPEFGHIFDHHAVVYEYASGTKVFAYCRQQAGAAVDVSDYCLGTRGTADIMRHEISGENAWRYRGEKPNMYQREHDELFAAIRSDEPVNNGDYMTRSSMLAIMGRMATYTGQVITWDAAMNSSEDLSPPSYDWGPLAVAPVAMPGLTSFR